MITGIALGMAALSELFLRWPKRKKASADSPARAERKETVQWTVLARSQLVRWQVWKATPQLFIINY